MMSQIVMSMSTRRSYSGRRMRASFFVTCVPSVVRYPSSYMLIVYRLINDVFPTPLSPTRQTFDFSCFCFVIRHPRPEPRPDFDAAYLTIRALFSAHASSSLSVEYRVRSQTATTPFAPWKNASLRRSRKPFSPMMSQTVMSMSIFVRSRVSNVISRFETFAPSVVMYRSSNSSWTNRRIREVLPTAASPIRQTFVLMRWASGIGGVRRIRLGLLKGSAGRRLRTNLFLRHPLEGRDAAQPPAHPGARCHGPQASGRARRTRSTARGRGQGGMAPRPRGRSRRPSDSLQDRLRPLRFQDRRHPEHKSAHR